MQIQIDNPQFQSVLFGALFSLTLILSVRKPKSGSFFAVSRTQELKGFAMLTIIFSHIGYFLSSNPAFLYPFSILAGTGVNLFLFISGFGLTVSAIRSPASVAGFYKKRLKKLFLPMWVVITFLIILDFVFLNRGYPVLTIFQSFLGFFPRADVFKDLDSPLWYFSLIFFYYLTFPIFFWKKFSYLCPLLILLLSFSLLKMPLPVDLGVLNLYKVHSLSFPLGVLFALLVTDKNLATIKFSLKRTFLSHNLKYLLVLIFVLVAGYTSVNSGVGVNMNEEQIISLITMFSFIFIFLVKDWEFGLFKIFGKYSYEIYLIHWPLLARYGVLYSLLPAALSTYLYLWIFLLLGYLLQGLSQSKRGLLGSL